MTPHPTTISAAADALRAGTTTSAELVEHALARADTDDAELGMFVTRFAEQARQAAAAADEALARDAHHGPLHGIPLAVKDIITTEEGPTSAQSMVLDRGWAVGDAPVVHRLRAAGAVVVGKTTTMEFAIGIPDLSKPFPIPANPWDLTRWAGGSSSGSASAVCAGAALGALGSDSGGSIRIPAANCGVTGLKPTFGRVPKSGCVPLGYSLDHVGPIARTARDCAILLGVLAGHDPSDDSSLDEPVPHYVDALTGELGGIRVGVDRLARFSGGGNDPALDEALDDALQVLRAAGADVIEVELPYYPELMSAGTVTLTSEALAYHRPDLQARWTEYAAGTRAVVGAGVYFSGADYVQAQRARRVGQRAVATLFDEVDLVVTPTVGRGASPLATLDRMLDGDHATALGPLYTQYWNAVGNPVLALPIGSTADGLPLSMQIAGRALDEASVLRAGDAYQARTSWHTRTPPVR